MRKHTLAISVILFISFFNGSISNAQTFANEWIDVSKAYYKIKIYEEGFYRIPQSLLAQHNILADGADYKMIFAGKEVALFVSQDGALNSDDYIAFYGNKLNGDFDTQLYNAPIDQLHSYESLFTDTATYFLTINTETDNLRINEVENNLAETPPARNFFKHQAVYTASQTFFEGVAPFSGDVKVNASKYERGEGFIGSAFAANTPGLPKNLQIELPTPGVFKDGPPIDIELKVVGLSDDSNKIIDHLVQIELNGTEILMEGFEGFAVRKLLVEDHSVSDLKTAGNIFKCSALDTAAATDKNAIAYIKIDYPRDYNFEDIQQLRFSIESEPGKSDLLEISNLEPQNVPPVLLDFTNNIKLEGIIADGIVSFHLPAGESKNRDLFIFENTSTTFQTVNSLERRDFIDFESMDNQGVYVIVAASNIMKDGAVDEYATYRSSEKGGNYTTTAVDVELLYDQFAYGIKKHPLAIKNFMDYGSQTWRENITHLLLVGKSIVNSKCRYNVDNWNNNLVPSYGEPPSDLRYGRFLNEDIPTIAVGRISVTNAKQVSDYLDKVKAYETIAPALTSCDFTALEQKKRVLHLFNSIAYENKFKKAIENKYYAANVIDVGKPANDPTPTNQLKKLIDSLGVNLIAYFDAADTSSNWNFDIGKASTYNNSGKYPTILSLSNNTGNIHQAKGLSMAEDWVLTKNAGAIAYLGASAYAFRAATSSYIYNFYKEISKSNYNNTIGSSVIRAIEASFSTDIAKNVTIEEITLEGDPAITITYAERPEFEIDTTNISFEPYPIQSNTDTFYINVPISNYGVYSPNEEIDLCLSRQLEDGSIIETELLFFPSARYKQIHSFKVSKDAIASDGDNTFILEIDCDEIFGESCTENNNATANLFIIEAIPELEEEPVATLGEVSYSNISKETVVPIFPCEYSIVNQPDVVLKATKTAPFIQSSDFTFQLDTTLLFNSNLLLEQTIASTGNFAIWKPEIDFSAMNGTVFYWRTADKNTETLNWENSSFIYNNDLEVGWNQSHYYQYAKGNYSENMTLNESSRQFEYTGILKNIAALTGLIGTNGVNGGISPYGWPDIKITLNNSSIVWSSCLLEGSCNYDGGIQFAVIEPGKFEPTRSQIEDVDMSQLDDPDCFVNTSQCCDSTATGLYGNIHCRRYDTAEFNFKTTATEDFTAIANFLDAVPNNHYIVAKSIQNHGLEADQFTTAAPNLNKVYDSFKQLGVDSLRYIQNHVPFLFLLQKGNPNFEPTVLIGNSTEDVLSFDRDVAAAKVKGSFQSAEIGPANSWNTLVLDTNNIDKSRLTEEFSVNVIGLKPNGDETILLNTKALQTSLTAINTLFYPKIKLEFVSNDSTFLTPPQLNFWRVHYNETIELAFDTSQDVSFGNTTIMATENFNASEPMGTIAANEVFDFSASINNISNITADSILVTYQITDKLGNMYEAGSTQINTIASNGMAVVNGSVSTSGLSYGLHFLTVEINPRVNNPLFQNEKYFFNNILVLPFYIDRGVGIFDLSTAKNWLLELYPLPAKNRINLLIETTKTQKAKIEIYNSAGQLVLTDNLNIEAGRRDYSIKINTLQPGSYLLHTITKKGKQVNKMLKY